MSGILLAEDNPHIMKINAEVLSLHGYEVLKAWTAAETREQLRWHPANLIVSDIMLPDVNGIELCRELKGRYHIPILFLTALGENQNVAEGLCASGDDYLTKPYDLEMLIARIEARLRSDANSRRYVCYGDLKLDTVSFIGYVNGSDILLTHRHIRPTPTVKSPEFRRPPTTETLRFWVRCCSYLSAC